MKITLLKDEESQLWDDYVKSHDEATPYHLYGWKKSIDKAYGFQSFYLVATSNGHVVGVMPMINIKPPFLGGDLVSLPYCDLGGILADNSDIRKQLLGEALVLAKKFNTNFLEIRTYSDYSSLINDGREVETISNKVSMLLDLPKGSDALWDSFKSKLRSQVRKAEKNGLDFKWGSLSDIGDFYKVFSTNMRDLGSPVHSIKWIEEVLKNYGENARLGLVYKESSVVGGGIILTNGGKVSIPWASTLREYNKLAPNMILYWNFLKYCADNGYNTFDFGRSTPGEGTYKFKAQWGAEEKPLLWSRFRVNGQFKEAGSGKRDIVAAAWSKLPLFFSNGLGPMIRKYISL